MNERGDERQEIYAADYEKSVFFKRRFGHEKINGRSCRATYKRHGKNRAEPHVFVVYSVRRNRGNRRATESAGKGINAFAGERKEFQRSVRDGGNSRKVARLVEKIKTERQGAYLRNEFRHAGQSAYNALGEQPCEKKIARRKRIVNPFSDKIIQ